MKDRRISLTSMMLHMMLTVNLLARNIDALLCYCTEEECLSGERSNMCVQNDASLGCYKQYYSKMNPAVTMGCVKYALLCDSSRIRPGQIDSSEWPYAACCFTDHCNRNLPLPIDAVNATTSSRSTEKTSMVAIEDAVTVTESSLGVHPVFWLLIILVIIFLIVVMAAVLVIIRIWFYRRRKAKPQKHWIIQQNMLHTKAQMSHLLTDEPYESALTCQQLSKGSVTSPFDVP